MANSTSATTGTNQSGEVSQGMPAKAPGDLQPSEDVVQYLKAYARAKPDVAALWCFGIGFVVGWKLKPW